MGVEYELLNEFMLDRYGQMLDRHPKVVDAIIYFAEHATGIPECDYEGISRVLREAEGSPIGKLETAILTLAETNKIDPSRARIAIGAYRAYKLQQQGHVMDEQAHDLILQKIAKDYPIHGIPGQ